LFYFFTYKIFGLNPVFFRLVNIFFHLGTTWLVYVLVSLIANTTLAFFSASLFAVHPILIESVTWISGGVHAQYSFFVLFSLIAYILYLSKKNKKFLIVSIIGFLIALNCSEKSIILPLLLLLFTFSFKNLSKIWSSLIPFFIISGYYGLRFIGATGARTTSLQTTFYQTPQKTNPFFQVPIAITSYLELIFWPKGLTLYHSEMIFSRGEYFFRAGLLILFLAVIVFYFKKNRHVFFWLSFFITSLLPMLTPLGISWIVAERYVYLGSLGILVVIAMAIKNLGERLNNPKIAYSLLIIILIFLSLLTIVRNNDWKNQDNLWLAAAKTSPSSPQNHNNLGDLYGRRGQLEKAAQEFQKAIELKPGYADAYHNLANIYHQMNQVNLAIANYQKALSFNPNLWQSHQNLAGIYFNQDQFGLAEKEMKKATEVNPQNSNLYFNLGIIYLKLDKKKEAQAAFQAALQLDPQNQKIKQALLSF
jgi:tetratricopeptide (TPR) repeat protein